MQSDRGEGFEGKQQRQGKVVVMFVGMKQGK
jgi:hypothetical protein